METYSRNRICLSLMRDAIKSKSHFHSKDWCNNSTESRNSWLYFAIKFKLDLYISLSLSLWHVRSHLGCDPFVDLTATGHSPLVTAGQCDVPVVRKSLKVALRSYNTLHQLHRCRLGGSSGSTLWHMEHNGPVGTGERMERMDHRLISRTSLPSNHQQNMLG